MHVTWDQGPSAWACMRHETRGLQRHLRKLMSGCNDTSSWIWGNDSQDHSLSMPPTIVVWAPKSHLDLSGLGNLARPEASIPKILPIILFPYSPAPVQLFSQRSTIIPIQVPIILNKYTLHSAISCRQVADCASVYTVLQDLVVSGHTATPELRC